MRILHWNTLSKDERREVLERPAQRDAARTMSDVRAIVLVDGVFHGRAPVWQRELLCAMESGIRVYGASSMGALRAAELHAHGMVGLGTIYAWYVTGEIDGDDEVALLHAGAEQRYRPLTEPLVNLRFNLREAYFHNGNRVTSADVKWTIEQMVAPKSTRSGPSSSATRGTCSSAAIFA